MKKCICLLVALLSVSGLSAQQEKAENFFKQQEFDKAITTGLEILKDNPASSMMNMLVGRAYVENNQFEKAIPYLKTAAINANDNAEIQSWAYAFLGRCFYVLNDYQKSKENLQACLALNASEKVNRFARGILNAPGITDFYSNWETVETTDIKFHFQNSANIQNKEAFIKTRQTAFEKINQFYNAKPSRKIDFYVWDDVKKGQEMLGRTFGFSDPTLCIIHSRNDQTRGHEITHVLVGQGIRPAKTTQFINEGIAVFMDGSGQNRFTVAKTQLAGKEINLIDLWENSAKYPGEYNYTIGGAWIAYLFEKGTTEQIKMLLKDQTLASARVIYPELNQLANDFVKKLKE
jgi:tetratricopeptide (TPR) repeat protein